jgi:hypothetical protein
MRLALVAAATAGVLVVGLSSPAFGSAKTSRIRSETLACFSQQAGSLTKAVPSYLGLSVSKAVRKAHRAGDVARIIAKDGKCNPSYADLQYDRVNFWVFDGRVIRASIF